MFLAGLQCLLVHFYSLVHLIVEVEGIGSIRIYVFAEGKQLKRVQSLLVLATLAQRQGFCYLLEGCLILPLD